MCSLTNILNLRLSFLSGKKVCHTKKFQSDKPFDVAPAGSRFLTSFGVVEVISDDRATPTGSLPSNLAQLNRKWSKYKMQYRQYFQERATRAGVNSLARRRQFSSLYQRRSDNATNIANIYDQEKSKILPPVAPSFRKFQADPAAPVDSYPDRIVVCKLVQNREAVIKDDGATLNQTTFTNAAEMRLYIRRHELTTPFSNGLEEYQCEDCGLGFLSIMGYKYHCRAKVCVANNEKKKTLIETQLASVEERAQRELARRNSEPPPLRVAIVPKHKVTDFPLYPQVLISLGFKLLPRSHQPVTVSAFRPPGAPRSYKPSMDLVIEIGGETGAMTMEAYTKQQDELETQKKAVAQSSKSSQKEFVHPDTTMKELEWQIQNEQSKFLGSMYPSVFKALNFKARQLAPKKNQKKPVPSVTKAKVIKKKKLPKKRKVKKVPERQPTLTLSTLPQRPLPPFIDLRILVEELSSGRYPSITRQPDDVKRSSKCSTCLKRAGDTQEPLYNCSFCPNTYHWSCARKRYTMKDPEPGDDLLCPRCIGIVQSRRNRAQKRRLEKLIDSDADAGRLFLANEKEAAEEELRLATQTVQGREYECVASQLRRLNELTELLKDAQIRLSNNLEVSRIEATNQATISSFERNALF
jgi:hypothetical protein